MKTSKCPIAILALAALAAAATPPLAAQAPPGFTKFYFTNATPGVDLSNYFLYFQGAGFDVRYSTDNWATTNSFSTSNSVLTTNVVSVSDLLSSSGGYVQVYNFNAVRMNVSYGQFTDLSAQPSVFTNNPNSQNSFTYLEGNVSAGVGNVDITYINAFEVPVRGVAYQSFGTTNQVAVQTNGFDFDNYSVADVYNGLAAIQPAGLGTNSPNFVRGTNGNVVRVISANQSGAGGEGTYAPMTNYLTHLQGLGANGYVNISRSNTLTSVQALATNLAASNNIFTNPTNGSITYSNVTYYPQLTGSVTSTSNLVMTGSISYKFWNTSPDDLDAYTTNFSGVSFGVDAPDAETLSTTMYQNPGYQPYYITNTAWNDAMQFGTNNTTFGDNTWQIPSADMFSAIVMGLAGNPNTNTLAGDSQSIRDLTTGDWWGWDSDAVIYYGTATTNTNFYYSYAGYVHAFSPNTYGYVYDDRFKFTPVLLGFGQTGAIIGGLTNYIDSVVFSLGLPVSAVPEVSTAVLVTLGIIGFAVVRTVVDRRRWRRRAVA